MKKSISVLAAAMLLSCTFVSCGSKDSSDDKDTIVGKWIPTEETLKSASEDEEVLVTGGYIEFISDNKMTFHEEIDYSSILCIDGDKLVAGGNSIEYTYDGTTITAGATTFVRADEADEDSVYGEYNTDYFDQFMDSNSSDEAAVTYSLVFESDGKSSLIATVNTTYEYDEENGTITTGLDEEDEGPSKVEIDGDKLTMTDSDGEVEIYTRAK